MSNFRPDGNDGITRVRRVVAFLGIFFVLLGQFLVYATGLDDSMAVLVQF
jgi:hypothetical protein